jgi:hypothetical protein
MDHDEYDAVSASRRTIYEEGRTEGDETGFLVERTKPACTAMQAGPIAGESLQVIAARKNHVVRLSKYTDLPWIAWVTGFGHL